MRLQVHFEVFYFQVLMPGARLDPDRGDEVSSFHPHGLGDEVMPHLRGLGSPSDSELHLPIVQIGYAQTVLP